MGYDFQKTYELKQWTPLIHFQSEQSGATLRATEVKPKLDRFLTEELGEGKVRVWKIDDHDALDYKMDIRCNESKSVDLGYIKGTPSPYEIYYGNMGKKPWEEKIKAVISSQVKMTITCFKPDLMAAIDTYLNEFLVVTNFGSMQNKGFGSFTIKNKEMSKSEIGEYLRKMAESQKCYVFQHNNTPFRQIKTVYGMMKTGINFGNYSRSLLFKYMNSQYNMGNEKAFLKSSGMAPIAGSHKGHASNNPPYYVRALMGVGDHIDFLNDPKGDKRDKTSITISNKDIARLSSPILFKVIGENVFFVGKRIEDDIYGKTFDFSVSSQGSRKSVLKEASLTVPDKETLGSDFIDTFLEYAVKELNNGELSKFKDTKSISKIEEV